MVTTHFGRRVTKNGSGRRGLSETAPQGGTSAFTIIVMWYPPPPPRAPTVTQTNSFNSYCRPTLYIVFSNNHLPAYTNFNPHVFFPLTFWKGENTFAGSNTSFIKEL